MLVPLERIKKLYVRRGGKFPLRHGKLASAINLDVFAKLHPHLLAVGGMPDSELARVAGIARQTIMTLRRAMGIPVAQRPHVIVTDAMREQFIAALKEGRLLKVAAESAGIPLIPAREIARTINWDASWSRASRVQKRSLKVGRLTKVKVLELDGKGCMQTEIARKAGVSRERIRQVLAKEGCEPRMVFVRRRKEARLRARLKARAERARKAPLLREKRRRALMAKQRRYLMPGHRLWVRGGSSGSIKALAERYGISAGSMGWWIFTGRSQHGLFPKRPPVDRLLRNRKRQDERRDRRRQRLETQRKYLMPGHRRWMKGASIRDIARQYEITYDAMERLIAVGRKRHGLFPSRATKRVA